MMNDSTIYIYNLFKAKNIIPGQFHFAEIVGKEDLDEVDDPIEYIRVQIGECPVQNSVLLNVIT